MYHFKFVLLIAISGAALCGCAFEEDQTKRPDFVDTSDPSKVMETMKAPPGPGGPPGAPGPGGPGPAGS